MVVEAIVIRLPKDRACNLEGRQVLGKTCSTCTKELSVMETKG